MLSVSWGRKVKEYAECKGFAGVDTILYEIMMLDTCHYISVITHQMYNLSEI